MDGASLCVVRTLQINERHKGNKSTPVQSPPSCHHVFYRNCKNANLSRTKIIFWLISSAPNSYVFVAEYMRNDFNAFLQEIIATIETNVSIENDTEGHFCDDWNKAQTSIGGDTRQVFESAEGSELMRSNPMQKVKQTRRNKADAKNASQVEAVFVEKIQHFWNCLKNEQSKLQTLSEWKIPDPAILLWVHLHGHCNAGDVVRCPRPMQNSSIHLSIREAFELYGATYFTLCISKGHGKYK